MIEIGDFLLLTRLDAKDLETCLEAGWILPRRERDGTAHLFSQMDVARAALIRDLKAGIGVNHEGVGVVLNLVDQLHGARQLLRVLLSLIDAQPAEMRDRILAEYRGATSHAAMDVTHNQRAAPGSGRSARE